MRWTLENVQVLQPGVGVIAQSITIRGSKIEEISPAADPAEQMTVDGRGGLLTPGLIDIHVHGIERFAFELGPDHVAASAGIFARYGTTCALPTLYKVMARPKLAYLETLTQSLDQVRDVCFPGWHLEGPFLALPGIGSDTVAGDLVLLEEILAATAERTMAMSVSPDTPNILPVIERLVERGIVPLITHTAATAEQTEAAIQAGARHATHFYDVFPVPPVTEPGVRPVGAVEAILAHPECSVDFICDGIHVPPIAVRAMLAAKGYESIVLITDANVGAGLPAGVYPSAWGFPVRVSPDTAARCDAAGHPNFGLLAGSTLTMDRGVNNLMRWLNIPEAQVWAMATANVARLMKLKHKGVIAPGADADLVLWQRAENGWRVDRTWVGGRCVYQREEQ